MASRTWHIGRGKELTLAPPAIMAIINVTPDSFSDGGKWNSDTAATAATHAVQAGAAIIDIGGESTRPGAARVSAADQIARVVPVIAAARRLLGPAPAISIDTTLAAVADAAIDAGADIVNDVSAGREDADMLQLCARRQVGVVLMHRLVPPDRDSYSDRYVAPPDYADVVQDVKTFLRERLAAAVAAGVPPERIALDPGLGFGKSVEHNLALIRGTPRLLELGRPILSGLSRKSFVARAAGMPGDSSPADRLAGTIGLTIAHAAAGASILRVHDVEPAARAIAAFHAGCHRSLL